MSDVTGKRNHGIGVKSAAALVAANMIGAGVFTTSGFSLADLGRPDFVLLAWVVGGGVALCGALSYSRLAANFPGNGGEYLFLSRTLHPLVGFLAGWVSLFAGFTAPIAVAAHGLEAYLGASVGWDLPPKVIGALAILGCGALHGLTRAGGVKLQDWAVATKFAAIVFFILFGAFTLLGGSESGLAAAAICEEKPPFSLSAFAVTLVWISFAYSGWNAAVYIAGELEAPERTLPRALIMATASVTAIYVALNAVFLYAAPVEDLAGRPEVGAIAAAALGGDWARAALSAVVALGLLTSISAMVMVGPRVYAQMADDGLMPAGLMTRGTEPRGAIALQVGLALAAFWFAELRELLDYAGFLLGLSAAATVACLFVPSLRKKNASSSLGQQMIPIIFLVMTLGSSAFLVMREPRESAIGCATLLVGALVYTVMRRSPGAKA